MLRGRSFTSKALWPAFLCLLAVAVVSPTLTAFFHGDDATQVYLLSQIRNPLAFFSDRSIWLQLNYAHFRPFPFLALWVGHQLSGLNPLGHHLIPALAVGVTAFLFSVALPGFGLSAAAGRLGAILFIVSPSTVAAAIWPAAQFDVWAALFIVLAFVLLVRARTEDRIGLYLAALGATLLALLSKESVMIVAGLLPFLDIARFRALPRLRQIGECAAWWGVVAAYLLWRIMMLGGMGGQFGWGGPEVLLRTMIGQDFIHRWMSVVANPGNLVLVLVFAVACAALLLRSPGRAGWYGALTVVCALPVLPLLPLHNFPLRYLYLPGLVLIACFVEAMVACWKSNRLSIRALGVVAFAISVVVLGKASAETMRGYSIEARQEEVVTRSALRLLRERDQQTTLVFVSKDAWFLDAALRLSGAPPSLPFRVIEPRAFLASSRLAQSLRGGAAMKVFVFQGGQTPEWRDETAGAPDQIEAHLALRRLAPPKMSVSKPDPYSVDLRIDAPGPVGGYTFYFGPWEAGFWQQAIPLFQPRHKGAGIPGVWFLGASFTDVAGSESRIAELSGPIRIGSTNQEVLRTY